jgi:hypothetical protein
MPGLPKLLILVLVALAAWYVRRWLADGARSLAARRPATRPPSPAAIEDLVACRVCGAYVAAGAPDCARRDCPRPG